MTKPIVAVDRDGTLIAEEDYLSDPNKVKILSSVIRGLKRLKRAGFPVVVLSNQSGIGRGWMKVGDVRRVNQRLISLLKKSGVQLDGMYWCPHLPSKKCSCRKPALGLLKRAARALGQSWKGALSIGDKDSDVAVGQRAGGQGVLVLTGYGRQTKNNPRSRAPDGVARNFDAAARWVIETTKKELLR